MLSIWQCHTSSASSERPSAALADTAWISAALQTGSDAICGMRSSVRLCRLGLCSGFRFKVQAARSVHRPWLKTPRESPAKLCLLH